MINTRRATYQSSVLAAEWGKHGKLLDNTQHTRDQRQFRMKAKSDETKAKEAAELRYQRRSNVCPECFELKAAGTGACSCTE